MVAPCNNREFSCSTAADFDLLFALRRELVRTYAVTVYAYALGTPDRVTTLHPSYLAVSPHAFPPMER